MERPSPRSPGATSPPRTASKETTVNCDQDEFKEISVPENAWLFPQQVTSVVDRELARTALSKELRGGQACPRPRRPAMVPLRGNGGWAERGRGPAFSYPQMPAQPAGSTQQLPEGRVCRRPSHGTGCRPSVQPAVSSSGLLPAGGAEVLSVHLKVHHSLSSRLTRSQTRSIKPATLAGKGAKFRKRLLGF